MVSTRACDEEGGLLAGSGWATGDDVPEAEMRRAPAAADPPDPPDPEFEPEVDDALRFLELPCLDILPTNEIL
jgi:hypothetical protein